MDLFAAAALFGLFMDFFVEMRQPRQSAVGVLPTRKTASIGIKVVLTGKSALPQEDTSATDRVSFIQNLASVSAELFYDHSVRLETGAVCRIFVGSKGRLHVAC